MFNQNNEEKKLDWMYKGPNSLVEREEYLLGRAVDKTLEQLNEEEKQKQSLIVTPKNRVEHECIPPSIRDFNKVVQAEQVDLSAKLQEDPLVAIKKREEESRRQFLQNPVQLKKLQKALKAQEAKRKKKKSNRSDNLDALLTEKLLGKKSKKISKEERDLDTILIHKYEQFKDKLTEKDLQDILNGKLSDSDESSEDEKRIKKSKKKKHYNSSGESEEEKRNKSHRRESKLSSDDNFRGKKNKISEWSKTRSRDEESKSSDKNKQRRYSSSDSEKKYSKNYDSEDSDSSKTRKVNFGLVTSEGKKIPLHKKHESDKKHTKATVTKALEAPPPVQKHRAKKLSEEEKEKLRQEMMVNAVLRDKERTRNVKKYREKEEKEKREQDFDPEFVHKQLMKSAHSSSVESRIKANLNNIQRSSRDMDKHFSRRH